MELIQFFLKKNFHGDAEDFYGMVAWLLGKERKVYKLVKTL